MAGGGGLLRRPATPQGGDGPPFSLALVTSGKGPRSSPPTSALHRSPSGAGRASPGGCAFSRPWQQAALRKLLTQRVAWRPASDVSLEPGLPRREGEGEARLAREAVRVRASSPVGAVGAALQRSCSAAAARAPVTHGASLSRCPRRPEAPGCC